MIELTYLQTTCAMYFNTGISPQDNYTYHLKFTPLEEVGWDGDGYAQFFGNINGGVMVRSLAGGFSQRASIQYGDPYNDIWDDFWLYGQHFDFYLDPSGYTYNGIRENFENDVQNVGQVTNSDNMFINAANGGGDEAIRNQTAKYEFVGIYDSAGTPVAEFVPVLDENNVCCFYDRINDNYIYNSGSGTPISGDVKASFIAIIEGDITAEENNYQVNVLTSSDWTASTSASYISFVSGNNLVSAVTGTAINSSCTVNILGNTGTTDRNVEINFVNADGDTYLLSATQKKPQTGSYVFCDYIQGQYGIGGSYLDLGIAPSLDTEIEIVLKGGLREQGSSNARIIGNGESGGIDLIARLDLYCQLDFGDATGIGSDLSMMLRNTKQKFTINSTGITREYVNITQTTSYNATELTGTTNNLMLNGDSASTCNAVMYGEVIIRKNGVVVFDGKPCVYGSQVGLYDFANDEFIAGQGKSFLAIDKYGVVLGGDAPKTISIGDDNVERIYIGDILVYMVAKEQPVTPSGWTVLTSSLSTSLPISKIRCSEPTAGYGNWCFSPVSGQTLFIGQSQNDCENINDAAHGYPWNNRFYCNDPNSEWFMWVFDSDNPTELPYDGTEYTFSEPKYLCAFDYQGVANAMDAERNVEVYIEPPTPPTPPTPVSDAISVSDNQVDNEVTFSVGFTSSTYNSIWESQIDNTAYDDAIGQGIDPDDVDWIISNGWENTNEGNPREAAAGIPCDGYKKVYFFLYDNINDSVSTATTWSNTYNGNGDCGESEMCSCEVCNGSGVIWNEEMQEEETCWNCGGSGEVICPEPDPEPEMCGCECCGGSGTIWDDELQEDRICECCDGTGQVPCP